MKYLLDIGNTCTDILELSTKPKIKKTSTEDIIKFIKKNKDVPMYISCVVREIERKFKSSKVQKFVSCEDLKKLVKIKYDTKNVGVDRLLNILSAQELVGNDTVIISAGTALVLDYLNKKGEFVGGEIFPGVKLITKILYQKVSRLPLVKNLKSKILNLKFDIIGNNTKDCILTGIINFYSSGINNFVQKISPKNVIITGGDAETIAKLINTKKLYLIQNLVLFGLTVLGYKNNFLTKAEFLNINSSPELKLKKINH